MTRLAYGLLVCAALGSNLGCRGAEPAHSDHGEQADHPEHAGEHEGEAAHAPGEHEAEGHDEHEAEGDQVRIDPVMLRDLRITTRPAEARSASETVMLLGELRVNDDTYAEVASSIAARVTRVLVAPGDAVTAGQPLIELESLDVGKARALLSASEVRLSFAEQAVARRRELAAEKIVAQRDMQASEAELAQAAAESEAARQSLTALGATRGAGTRFVLTAPLAGTVIERLAVRGTVVDAGQRLLSVGDLRKLWLIAHAFERDALRVRLGGAAQLTFAALPGQSFSGRVARIGSQVDPSSRTLDVRIELDNPSGTLRPGMSASALVPVGDTSANVVAVPVEALQRKGSAWSVFLPTAVPGSFEQRSVGRGRDLGGEVEVLSGLTAGEKVVVDGAFLLRVEADKQRGGGAEEHHH